MKGADAPVFDIGIDAGAISTKVLIMGKDNGIAGHIQANTTMEPGKLAGSLMMKLLEEKGIHRTEISHIVATGQGRRSVELADLARTDITTFAKGAHFIDPDVDIVVDIGGHGIRVMRMEEMGVISDFRTNDKCSTGTGCFMDTMAAALEVSIEEAGERSLHSKLAEHVNASCTVFAESEVVSLIAKGKRTDDILAGLHKMVARKIVSLVNSTQSKGRVMVCGGVARNEGVIKEIRGSIDREVMVPELPHMVGAMGAALSSPSRKRELIVERPQKVRVKERTLIDRLLRWKG
ncbi:MAG: acyl-CoA dehydratase activase [Thermoplasmatota archaeon]